MNAFQALCRCGYFILQSFRKFFVAIGQSSVCRSITMSPCDVSISTAILIHRPPPRPVHACPARAAPACTDARRGRIDGSTIGLDRAEPRRSALARRPSTRTRRGRRRAPSRAGGRLLVSCRSRACTQDTEYMYRMHARVTHTHWERGTRPPDVVSLGSKRLPLVPLSACARVCRFRSQCTPSTQAFVVASASTAASVAVQTAISVSLLCSSRSSRRCVGLLAGLGPHTLETAVTRPLRGILRWGGRGVMSSRSCNRCIASDRLRRRFGHGP